MIGWLGEAVPHRTLAAAQTVKSIQLRTGQERIAPWHGFHRELFVDDWLNIKGAGMAGKRQHYIPKFLQRQFLARNHPPEKGECVWWHFRGRAPKPLEISNIGVEEYFYSRLRRDGVPTLDDRITAQESGIQNDLAVALGAPSGAPMEPALAARLVAHFVLRTAFTRAILTDAATEVVHGVVAAVGTVEGSRAHLGIDAIAMSPHLKGIVASVTEELQKANPSIPPRFAERFLRYLIRERYDEMMSDLDVTMAKAKAELIDGLSTKVADAHKKVLEQEKTTAWENALARLSWRIYSVDGAILPDCVAIARTPGRDWMPLLLAGTDALGACVFPIADGRLLFGTVDVPVAPNLDDINAASAACSDTFFIAAIPMNQWASSLGLRTTEVIRGEIDDALKDIRQPTTVETEADADARDARVPWESPTPFSYTLSHPTLDSAEQRASFQRLVRMVVYEMSRTVPLEALDGITFASDYPAALAQLDRGDAKLSPDLNEPRTYGTPIAKAVSVRRDGQKKHHLVFGWAIAADLLSDDERMQRASLQTIVSMLAHLAHDALYAEPFERTKPVFPNSYVQLIHPAAASAPGYYYTHRIAAFAAPEAGHGYATLFRDCLHIGRQAMATAHADYSKDGNIDALLHTALKHARHVVDHAAQWCGHNDGLSPNEATLDTCTGQSIIDECTGSSELTRWLELLHADLRELYAPGDSFTADRIFGLTQHVERVLWAFRVCPWPMEDGGTYVTVPSGSENALGLMA